MSKKVSDDFGDEHLIEMVQNRILYDRWHADYRNVKKNNYWKKIGDCLQKEDHHCRKRWKDIRDNYFKVLRREKLPTGSAAPRLSKKWPLFNSLTFLNETERERSSFCSIYPEGTENSDILTSDDDGFPVKVENKIPSSNVMHSSASDLTPSTFHNTPRKKLWDIINKRSEERLKLLQRMVDKQQPDDEVELFMKSIAATLRTMPRDIIDKAKIDILRYVTELRKSLETVILCEEQTESKQ